MKSKLSLSSGIFNVIIGALLGVDCIVLGIVAVFSFLMMFSLFFLAAIPAFLIFGSLFLLAAAAAIVNVATGAGAIITSIKGGKLSKVISAVCLVADAVVLPAQIVALTFFAMGCAEEPNAILIGLIFISAIAAALCIAGTVINILRLVNDAKPQTII